jgi:phenylalanyl-tRNA synthetase beta chain
MNISYNWLRELTEISLAPHDLARRLTMVGLAVDAIHEAGEDFIFEFDLTSNRPDCLSHLGIAREVAVVEQSRVSLPVLEPRAAEGHTHAFASVEIEDAGLCPRYSARVVRGVRIAPSPAWLAERLQAIGQRPINNVTDITNYVLHELGQPLHAFDLSTLTERRIVVRRARTGEKLRTLDGIERQLDEEMLVIADAARAVAIAGVMGGEETEISDATSDVLIESAYFNPASVRRTSKELGLQTEASYRFERGTDYEGVLRASERCVALICEVAGGTAAEDAIDVYPKELRSPEVRLRFGRVEALTGLEVPPAEALRILESLGFTRGRDERASESEVALVCPTWRVDVEREEDLVEEVARHYGFEKITEALPASGLAGEYREGEARRRDAARALTANGFDQAISFSFIDEAHDGQFDLLPGLVARGGNDGAPFVSLVNPIIEGATRMRATLLPGLLGALRHNFNHGTRNVRLFESGRVFAARTGELPDEREALALVLTGGAVEECRAGAASRELDFYDLKGALEAAADALGVASLEFEEAEARHLREGQAARVLVDGEVVGSLGRLAEGVAAGYKFRQPVFVAELNFGALLGAAERRVRYQPLARFPSVVRDISLVADRRVAFAAMRRAVLELGFEDCRGVSLVDVYEGANLPEGRRSLTLRVEYRADERTLRDEEVDEMHARVVGTLETSFGAQLRG